MLDILFLSRSSLLYAALLLPAITILSLALLCFAYEATQKFRRRRGLFKKTLSPKAAAVPRLLPGFRRNSAAGKSLRRCLYLWKRLLT